MKLTQTCLLCSQSHQQSLALCPGCQQDLPWLGHHCQRCAQLLPHEQMLCGQCLQTNPIQQRTLAAFEYCFPITPLIQQLKNNRPLVLARLLGRFLAQAAQKSYADDQLPQVLIPIPLHRKRLGQRGHNPAALLGFFIEQQLKIPCLHEVCERIQHTPPQQGLNYAERQKNLRHAFTINPSGLPKNISHLALIDDVVTTGATTQALMRLLKPHVERIDVWCVARTLQKN